MNYAHAIRSIVGEQDGDEVGGLGADEAGQLFAAMLDGGLPELELGALLVALGTQPLSQQAMLGFDAALAGRVLSLPLPCGGEQRPVVIPSYGGALRQTNFTPLLALLLQRLHVPVLVHGTLEGHGRVASAYTFRELGVLPCTTLSQARNALEQNKLAFVPTGVLAPGLAQLLSLRSRTGIAGVPLVMTGLIDPFRGAGLRIATADSAQRLQELRDLLLAAGATALVSRGTEGEAFVNPHHRPRIEHVSDGVARVLFEQEHAHDDIPAAIEATIGPRATADLIRRMLAGAAQLPLPILNQVACCLYAAGHAADLNEAKAIVAVDIRGLAAA